MSKSSSDNLTSGLGRVLPEQLVLLEDRVDGGRREGGDLIDDGLTWPQVPRVPIDLRKVKFYQSILLVDIPSHYNMLLIVNDQHSNCNIFPNL